MKKITSWLIVVLACLIALTSPANAGVLEDVANGKLLGAVFVTEKTFSRITADQNGIELELCMGGHTVVPLAREVKTLRDSLRQFQIGVVRLSNSTCPSQLLIFTGESENKNVRFHDEVEKALQNLGGEIVAIPRLGRASNAAGISAAQSKQPFDWRPLAAAVILITTLIAISFLRWLESQNP